MLSQTLSLTLRQTNNSMENIALLRNYYYKITRGDQGHFFGLYAGNYFLSIDEAMEALRQVGPIFARRQANIVSGPIKLEKQVSNEKFLAGSDGKLVKKRREETEERRIIHKFKTNQMYSYQENAISRLSPNNTNHPKYQMDNRESATRQYNLISGINGDCIQGDFVYNRLTTTEESSSTGYTTYAQVSFINEDDDNEVVIGTGISEDGVHAETEEIAGIQSFIDHSIEEQQAAGDEQAADRGTLSLIMRVSKSPCPACGQALIDFISNKYNGVSLQLSIIADHLYHGSTLDEARQTISDMEAVGIIVSVTN